MKINNNIQALNAHRNLYQNQFQTSKNLEKLSSGLRINRAADDAAGLAISEKMRSQIRGLKMAERNAMDGISLMQTSEGAMQEVHAMLQRMRELAVQAANDTNTEYDREQIQKEIDQLKLEIDSISEKTEFNTRKLLNGFSAVLTTFDAGANEVNLEGFPRVTDANLKSGEYRLIVENVSYSSNVTQPSAGLKDGDISFADAIGSVDEENKMKLGEYSILVREVVPNGDAKIEILDPDGLSVGTKVVGIGTNGTTNETVAGIQIDTTKISTSGTVKIKLEVEADLTLQRSTDGTFEPIQASRTLTSNNGMFRHGGVEYNFYNNIEEGNLEFTITNNALSFQIGPNTNQNVMIDIPKMDVVTLGIEEVSVLTNADANKAIFQIDQAINKLSDARAKLGAVQNRLEHTVNNLQVTHENLTASESRIRDADMALLMTEFTRNNILNQSATAMLAQANQLPQGVLQLLQ
ncbi:flagellin [Halalkalibacterium halodurans]|uniref:flagellin N-terminal helical domain-containing protein n=1 Tax=Halalkalibacterium halodurans TaxID=86665 RepID=UPI002E2150E0|nr:flagellin [Halalkalibacterium halodurans]MED4082888.1 flagellin [Halalkalibacterium halodurans]MED4084774.1 flagellin [Halalkalibacterium halodurans]MED4106118.1 flagellin [Halalkalibacterium halodurans]MED4110689.1 flagellin [Halalkalibacterium halodurans]MED4150538.1 flagellin [Halalkalibacterium halodurans]